MQAGTLQCTLAPNAEKYHTIPGGSLAQYRVQQVAADAGGAGGRNHFQPLLLKHGQYCYVSQTCFKSLTLSPDGQ
jgi:hypothetical protein